jgi:hypothetical protein
VVTYHEEAVSNPEAVPVVGAVRDVHILAVDGQHVSVHLAHHTSEKREVHHAEIEVGIRTLIVKRCMYDVKPL